jgi:phage terminase small subunit
VSLSLKQKSFVNAYLGEANGNATKAAIIAGYSERTAKQAGSRLLTHVDVQRALERRLHKAQMTADEALERVALIARADVTDISASDAIRANELILKVNGRLRDRSHEPGGITVNIGFLTPGQPTPSTITIDTRALTSQLVMDAQQ